MSVNYKISDIFSYVYTGQISTTNTGAAATAEVFTIDTTGAFATSTQGEYFVIYSANDATGYYVWNDTAGNGTTGDPAPPGLTEIAVDTSTATNDAQIATAIHLAIDALGDFSAPVPVGNVVTVTNAATGPTTNVNNSTATLDPWQNIAVAVTTQGSAAPSSSTGLLYRDASNNNEVRVLGASSNINYVLTTTATNVIGWASPTGSIGSTAFLVRPTSAQTIASSAITSFTTVSWGTEIIDTGSNFAANVYTIPSTALYHFAVILEWATSNSSNKGERRLEIAKDPGGGGETVLVLIKEQPNSDKTITFYQHASIIYNATAAQTIGVRVSQNSGNVLDVGTESRFMGWLLSA